MSFVSETDDQACQTPTSPEAADAVMTDEEANDIVSVLSSSTVPSTLPSTVHPEEADSPMGDKEGEDQGQKQVQAGVNPRSFGNQQIRLPSRH